MSNGIPNNVEQLYLLLDENYYKYCNGKQFWKALHAIDKELVPGCISVEEFTGAPATHLVSGEDTTDAFAKGEKTLVFRFSHGDAAVSAAKIFNHIFMGCGTEFVPECVEKDGKKIPQVRSNLDKRHWEKLCVFCAYRFDREITDEKEKKALQAECQNAVSEYGKGTELAEWHAAPGFPAFCVIMGYHGNLRPPKHYEPDARRKEKELNEIHPRGTPLLFSDIVMYVEMNKHGDEIKYRPYHYNIMFDVRKLALKDATNDKKYPQIVCESFGGYPFEKGMSPSSRAAATVGLLLGLYGLYHVNDDITGAAGPMASLGVAVAFGTVTYLNHKHKLLERFLTIEKENGRARTITVSRKPGQSVDLQLDDPEISPEIRDAYTGRSGLRDEIDSDHFRKQVISKVIRDAAKDGNEPDAEAGLKSETIRMLR